MVQYTKQQLIQKIQELGLEKAVEAEIISKIEVEKEVTPELRSWVKGKIQGILDTTFAAAGVGVKDNADGEYKQRYEKMVKEIDTAEKDFKTEMDSINKEVNTVRNAAAKDIDDIQTQTIKDQI